MALGPRRQRAQQLARELRPADGLATTALVRQRAQGIGRERRPAGDAGVHARLSRLPHHRALPVQGYAARQQTPAVCDDSAPARVPFLTLRRLLLVLGADQHRVQNGDGRRQQMRKWRRRN